jgi:hypothetical protein
MSNVDEELMSIGAFSARTRLFPKALGMRITCVADGPPSESN